MKTNKQYKLRVQEEKNAAKHLRERALENWNIVRFKTEIHFVSFVNLDEAQTSQSVTSVLNS